MSIKEISTEPEIIYTGSSFLLKVKVQENFTWDDLKTMTWNEVKEYTFAELKGE